MSGFIYGRNPNADTLDGLDSAAFALLAGRAGGQTLQGGTGASETLTLVSTSNATKGGITLTGSHVILPGSIRPVADTTTAITLCKANGDAVVTVDTTNSKINVSGPLRLGPLTQAYTAAQIYYNSADANVYMDALYQYDSVNQFGNLIFRTTPVSIGNQAASMIIQGGGNVGIGTITPATRLDIGAGAMTFAEMTAPGAGAANAARIYAKDNGSGKTQLMVQFATGGEIQLAIEA